MVVETSLIFPRGGEPPRLWIRVVKKNSRDTKLNIYHSNGTTMIYPLWLSKKRPCVRGST